MLAASAEAFADGAAGVVVTHGTDTLAVSATALAFGWAGGGGCPGLGVLESRGSAMSFLAGHRSAASTRHRQCLRLS